MKHLYKLTLKPKSINEDDRRREFILNVLLIGMIGFAMVALSLTVIEAVIGQADQRGTSLLAVALVNALFIGLFRLSRSGRPRLSAYFFVTIFFIFATFPFVAWGILVPQGVLTYALIIVIAGVLIGSASAFRIAGIMTIALAIIKNLEDHNVIEFYTDWQKMGGGYDDVITYGVTFMVVALVSWLSNREIERSLHRARKSERALRIERNSLEVKVKERTKELEKAQVEKMLELNRFAEFGRVSSALLHELTNPLTSLSLNLEQLEVKQQSKLIKQVRESITFMEQYVDNARRQLRKNSDIRSFDSATEIIRVVSFVSSKAQNAQIRIVCKPAKNIALIGDSIRFNQIIANLLVNAIDAYADTPTITHKKINIDSKKTAGTLQIFVSDNGKGIPKSDLAHIFEPFFTTKPSNRGTGLGLTITQRAVVEDFQGKIKVRSSKTTGTKFIVTLPLQ